MGILDNDTVIVDAILTKIGRQKLAQGQPLGISKFAFGDTGVDYTLYNPNHPSGSDSYGSAITSLPMLEAVPDDNVFLRSKLWTGNRNVQNFSFITVENTSPTITKIAGQAESNSITIIPTLFPKSGQAIFDFKVMDIRGISITSAGAVETLGESGTNPSFDYPDPVIANIRGLKQLVLTAASGYSTQKSFGIEVTAEGAAPIFITVTVEENITLG
tara:strand:- start:627 stop:1274 length:648 start_codon:yes stop_codon:yes gene_type:complete